MAHARLGEAEPVGRLAGAALAEHGVEEHEEVEVHVAGMNLAHAMYVPVAIASYGTHF
jgi:hypothetical protein